MKNPRIIITVPDDLPADGATLAAIEDAKALAAAQNVAFETMRDVLNRGKKIDMALEERAEQRGEELQALARRLSHTHQLNTDLCLRYFAANGYYPHEQAIPVFDANYTTAEGWKLALTEPIDNPQKFANVLPAGVTTSQAIGFLASLDKQTRQKMGDDPVVILEIGPSRRENSAVNLEGMKIDINSITPDQLFPAIGAEMDISLITPTAVRPTQYSAVTPTSSFQKHLRTGNEPLVPSSTRTSRFS